MIQNTIRKEFSNVTVFTFAHRINTIIDRLFFLRGLELICILATACWLWMMVAEFDSPCQLLQDKNSVLKSTLVVVSSITRAKVPVNRVGSWGIIASLVLRSEGPILEISWPSIRMTPLPRLRDLEKNVFSKDSASTIRKREQALSDYFYQQPLFLISIAPLLGQFLSDQRSTDTSAFSASVAIERQRSKCLSTWVRRWATTKNNLWERCFWKSGRLYWWRKRNLS